MQQQKTKKRKLKDFARRNEKWGFILLAPWMVGVVLFLLYPLIQVVIYSFSSIKLDLTGIQQSFVGIKNYVYLFKEHATFYQVLLTTFAEVIPDSIIIVFFALFAAILLNGEYKGRTIARVIFFLPIIMATDLISVELATTGVAMDTSTGDSASGMMFLADFIINNTGLPKELISTILGIVGGVFDTIKLSGVQTLIFLAGLQAINPSLYEVAKIEGATGYETFCKVTIPMISPMILICAVYTITDALTRAEIVDLIHMTGFKYAEYGQSSAMSVIFLVAGLALVGITAWLIGKKVYYSD